MTAVKSFERLEQPRELRQIVCRERSGSDPPAAEVIKGRVSFLSSTVVRSQYLQRLLGTGIQEAGLLKPREERFLFIGVVEWTGGGEISQGRIECGELLSGQGLIPAASQNGIHGIQKPLDPPMAIHHEAYRITKVAFRWNSAGRFHTLPFPGDIALPIPS